MCPGKNNIDRNAERGKSGAQAERCEQQKDVWYLDTGASNHMSGCKELFMDLDEGVKGTVRFGDGSLVDIQGRGKVVFQCQTGEHRVLTSVYYIPCLRSNIVSIGQLDEVGVKTAVEHGYMVVSDQGKVVAKVKRSLNRLYILYATRAQPVCLWRSMVKQSGCGTRVSDM